MAARLQEHYTQYVVPTLMKEWKYSSPMEVPRIVKITLNMGLGKAVQKPAVIENAVTEMTQISGQKPVVTKARKAIANFKIREELPIGCKVTLRRQRMYEMLDRLITIALPRVRDFRGLSDKAFDGRGNYSFGLKEQIIFPEISFDAVDEMRGMDVCITTTAKTNEEAKTLLAAFGFPFRGSSGPVSKILIEKVK